MDRLDNRKEIELAEGISVYLYPAGLVPRLIARLIDIVIQSLAYSIVAIPLSIIGGTLGAEVQQGIYLLIAFGVYWFYDPLFELSKNPATPGKRFMKLRVVQISGAPTVFRTSFLRALLWPIDLFPAGLLGIGAVLSTQYSQRLGDLAAGTLVIHTMEIAEPEIEEIPVDAMRPSMPLKREEQVAFIEFARRFSKLSEARQLEVTRCFEGMAGKSGLEYALGVSRWLTQNEV